MSDTPRTDAEYKDNEWDIMDHIPLEFCRQLEMELAVSLQNQVKAQSEIERLRKENNEFLLSEAALAQELKISDDWLRHTRNEVARLRELLELIACPERPDGTYNRDRRACELLAKDALKAEIEKPVIKKSLITEPTTDWRELGPGEVIQVGDERTDSLHGLSWRKVENSIGTQPKRWPTLKFRTRRPLPKPKLELELKAEIK